MTKRAYLILFFLFHLITSKAQNKDVKNVYEKNGIYKHSTLSTHPFGIFFSRVQQNFKTHASKSKEFAISIESGNVWGPYVKTFIPNAQSVRDFANTFYWDQRQYKIGEDTISAKTFDIKIDGVIKGLRASMSFPINKHQELNIGIRTFLLTRGKPPFSVFTSDEFIEIFHSKVAGGDDPFDRSVFGLNQAEISYTDRNGRTLRLDNNSFIFGGIEASYYYYPEFLINKKQNLHFNFGLHLGTNLSKYNSSMDLGATASAVKQISVFNTNDFTIGVGFGVLRKNMIAFNSENIEFGTNDFLGNIESAIEYHFVSKGKTTHAFSTNFYIQSSLNSKKEYNYIIPIRPTDGHKAWGHGTTNLYKNNNYWTFMYTFSRKIATSFYLQQDFTVNNNPDIQTGISLRFGL